MLDKEFEKELDSGDHVGKFQCIANEVEGKRGCNSSDGLSCYEHESDEGEIWYDAYCYSCTQNFTKDQTHSTMGDSLGVEGGKVVNRVKFDKTPKLPPMKAKEVKEFIAEVGYKSNDYRDIKDEYSKFFGHLTKLDENGKVLARYYPETTKGRVTGYKCRNHPKNFRYGKIGKTGKKSDLSGQVKFKSGGKYILIVGGEEDKVAAYQMLRESQIARGQGEFSAIPVVSPTTGETSALAQIKSQYEYLDSFENIIIGFDSDEAGVKATSEVAKALPKEKVKIATWSGKDPNKMLQLRQSKQFVRDFYQAKDYVKSGIKSSVDLDDEMIEELLRPKITLPPFMSELQKAMAGGIPIGVIINIAMESGGGKCFAKGTKILMADTTTKNVEDVEVGDQLMGDDGSPRQVVKLGRGSEEMFEVSQIKGDTYTVNKSHILSLRVSIPVPSKGWGRGDIINIEVSDYLRLPPKAKGALKGYKADLTNMGKIKAEFEPYMLGLWLADGEASMPRIHLHADDTELHLEITEFCERNSYSCEFIRVKGKAVRCYIKGGFKDDLRVINVLGDKHIPNMYLTSDYDTRIKLLSGLLDGDGYKTGGCYEIIAKSDVLANDIVTLARSLGLYVSTKKKFSKCQNFEGRWYNRLHISGSLEKLELKLPRKQFGERKQIKKTGVTSITVTSVGQGDYYGFEIDGNKLFCLADFTVTHNTTFVNEMINHWIFNIPFKMGVLSLELSAGQYGLAMLSRHIGKKLQLFEDGQDAIDYINQPWVKAKRKELWEDEYGEPRWYVLDERDGSLDEAKRQCEILHHKYGCTLLVLDPLQDLLDGASNEEQAVFMRWQKAMVKNGVTFININHVRKSPSGSNRDKDGKHVVRELREDDIQGTSAIPKSGAANIMCVRDKYAEDELDKNTTHVTASKIRWSGFSGPCGKWYYDVPTHTVYDLDTFLSEGANKEENKAIKTKPKKTITNKVESKGDNAKESMKIKGD